MAWRLPAVALRPLIDARPGLQQVLWRYAHAFIEQACQTALSNRLDERLARWLLMARDRFDGDDLEITHELLAVMLGVRRCGVTEALQTLQGRRLIAARRGRIRIVDPSGLATLADGSYGVAEAAYERLVGGS